jgi:hypothetical protein
MTVYYVLGSNEDPLYAIGSFNKYKIEQMYKYKVVHSCDISVFRGRLLSSEWL